MLNKFFSVALLVLAVALVITLLDSGSGELAPQKITTVRAAPITPLGEFSNHKLMHDGMERSYSIYKPKNLPPEAPVVIALHASRGSGKLMRELTAYEFDLLADKNPMLVIYPDGFEGHWNDCRLSADYEANKQNIDDPNFLITIIEEAKRAHLIDPTRVLVTGFSNGGHMVYRLALEKPDHFAAFAAIAANLPVSTNLDCTPKQQAVSIAIFNGSIDPINPHEGGLVSVSGNDSRGHVRSSEQTARYWRSLAEFPDTPDLIKHPEVDGNVSTRVVQHSWVNKDATEVRLYTLEGSGHVIPSKLRSYPEFLGGDAGDVSGPEEMVNFLLRRRSQ